MKKPSYPTVRARVKHDDQACLALTCAEAVGVIQPFMQGEF
jgi:hypothetical protein